MVKRFEEFTYKMRTAPDDGLAINESAIVKELFADPPEDFDAILRWILVDHHGFIYPRVLAGLRFIERRPDEAKRSIEQLLASSEWDDRDTALQLLGQYGDDSWLALGKPLLLDSDIGVLITAVDVLQRLYPEDAAAAQRVIDDRKANG